MPLSGQTSWVLGPFQQVGAGEELKVRAQGPTAGGTRGWLWTVHPGSGLLAPNPQKIMHTRKRHQDMFQDLNRKLQHTAEKEKEVPGVDSKVRRVGSAPTTTNLTSWILDWSFPVLAVPSQMCTGQGRRILSLALPCRFQTVHSHSIDPDPIMGAAVPTKTGAVGCRGCCSLGIPPQSPPLSPPFSPMESLPFAPALPTLLASSSLRNSRLPTRGPGRASASPMGRPPG